MKDKIVKLINAAWFPGILILMALAVFSLVVFLQQPAPEKTAAGGQGTLTVTVSGIRNTKGNIIICLYRAGPLTDLTNIADAREIASTGNTASAVFSGVSFREYAVFVLHDENGNRITDTGPDGVPIEGMGITGAPISAAQKPEFASSKFLFNQPALAIEIPLTYW